MYVYMYMYTYTYMYTYMYTYTYMYIWTISECNFIRAGINRLINCKSVQGFIEQGDGRRGNMYFNTQQHLSYKPSGALEATRSNSESTKFTYNIVHVYFLWENTPRLHSPCMKPCSDIDYVNYSKRHTFQACNSK